MNYKKQAENIASLGRYLSKNYKDTTLTSQVEEELLETWGVSAKAFNKIFAEYKSITRRVKIGHPDFSQKGGDNSRARKVKNIETGEHFYCIRDAAISLKMNVKTLRAYMRLPVNKTPIRYIEKR